MSSSPVSEITTEPSSSRAATASNSDSGSRSVSYSFVTVAAPSHPLNCGRAQTVVLTGPAVSGAIAASRWKMRAKTSVTRVLASYNIKGGVGKTAAAVNLAYLSAKEGLRTLLCDIDPQG